jgi:hypothetical protein
MTNIYAKTFMIAARMEQPEGFPAPRRRARRWLPFLRWHRPEGAGPGC